MSEGAVWLHRKLMDSDIWTASDTTLKVMIACLLMANWEDQQWFNRSLHKSQLIPRGSFITTQDRFSKLCALSRQNVRTCLLNLANMQFLTQNVTGRVTQITVLKYNDYQKLSTRRVTDKLTIHQPMTNHSSTRLEEVKEVKELKEGGIPPLDVFVNQWQRREDRASYTAEIAMGLKAYKLSFRVEEDIYNKIMGTGGDNGTVRSKSISEQVAERRRAQGLKEPRNDLDARTILERIGNLPKVQPET